MENGTLTAEQLESAKVANATGFINQRIHDAGRSPEQAQEDLKRAFSINEKLASQIPKIQEIVRANLKAA